MTRSPPSRCGKKSRKPLRNDSADSRTPARVPFKHFFQRTRWAVCFLVERSSKVLGTVRRKSGRDLPSANVQAKFHCSWRVTWKAAQTRLSEKSITLVRNRDNQLPLDPQKVKRILLHLAISPVPGWKDSLDVLKDCLIARGIELTVLENGNSLDVLNREAAGERWDAWIVVFSLQIH